MQAVNRFRAVSCRNKIFVLGNRFDDLNSNMVAQVYDPELNSWSLFEQPPFFPWYFTLVSYHEKLFFIGGPERAIKTVEVFDFETNTWCSVPDLPHAFVNPEAIVLNDQLIVYNSFANQKTFPAVTWCEEEKLWKSFKELKPFHECLFCTMEDDVQIRSLLRVIRDSEANFEKTPFDF